MTVFRNPGGTYLVELVVSLEEQARREGTSEAKRQANGPLWPSEQGQRQSNVVEWTAQRPVRPRRAHPHLQLVWSA